ncbi:MAG: response regulator, partial [Candidatus Dormibacteraeota bacterium]|nr:response regulator [Candidatus Dormibacteraeota bacterium]
WAARLLGASIAVLATDDGKLTVTRGIEAKAGRALVAADASGEPRARSTSTVVQARLESQFSKGVLAVQAGPLTPLFGAEEVARLQDYASSVTTALDRVLLVERVRRTGELLDLAYNPILAWDARNGQVRYWNRAAQAMYGWTSEEALGQEPSALLHSALPVPRDELVQLLRDRGGWEAEISQVTKDGRHVIVSARWALQLDDEGNPDVVLEINRDVTREKQSAEDLRRARDEAERASAAKSEYLSRMSHELRTPLTAILGYSDLLELRDPRDDQLEAVTAIQEASSHLLSLVNDVLDIARIEAGRETLAPEPVSLGAVVEECMRLVRPAARDHGISVNRELDGTSDAVVQADRQRLVQALLNLMSNAVKYAGRGASVTVRAETTPDSRVRLSVVDTGPGLSSELQRRLFQPFERLGAERTGTPGTGLGLALTKKLVEAMGGEIGVTSEEGRGSTFWITLQRAALEAVPERRRPPVRQEQPAADAAEHTVLYVEDNLATVDLMEDVFAMRPGIRMINALQGSIALDLAREHNPSLIVLDLHLPDMSGDQVLKQLREDSQTASIPVVMFSADATERQIKRLLDMGARAYIVKPAKIADFLAMLDEVLAPSKTAV